MILAQTKIKKALALLLSLLLAGAFVSCTPAPKPEITASSAQTEAPAPEESSAPETTSVSETTPVSEAAPEPEDDALPTGTLLAVDEDVISSVQIYPVADDAFNQPDLEPYTAIDLNNLEFYHEFTDSYDTPFRIIFMADTPVKNFRYLEIETVFEEDLGIVIVDTLYQLDALTPEEPFVVNWMSIGDIGMLRGISFVDENNVTRYFGFNTSGKDGHLYFVEFKPK